MRTTKNYTSDQEKLKDIKELLYWAKYLNNANLHREIKFTTVDESHYIPKYEKKDRE